MKTSRVFWGVFFLIVGVLLLLERFNVFTLEWHYAWKLWPLILVLWGVAILVKDRNVKLVAAALIALGLAVVVFTMVGGVWGDGDDRGWGEGKEQEFSLPYNGALHRASLAFQSGAGSFKLSGATEQLFSASTRSDLGSYVMDFDTSEGGARIKLYLEGGKRGWRFGRANNSANIQLNTVPVWELRFDGGASHLDLDLTPFNVERVDINTGAATVRLKLGALANETSVRVHAGASAIRILVPESAGCEINTHGALSSKNFPGFRKSGQGKYASDNFDAATRKISIDIEAAVSSLKANRY